MSNLNRPDSQRAWSQFRYRIEFYGGTVLEKEWKGNNSKHHIKCKNGHDSYIRPRQVTADGKGICGKCVIETISHQAWLNFIELIEKQGGKVIEPKWKGNNIKHRVICKNGHNCNPKPGSIQQGQGMCEACANRSPDISKEKFYKKVNELGGIPLENDAWWGNNVGIKIQCMVGHVHTIIPKNLLSGGIICREIYSQEFTVVYVVRNHFAVKYGITSGNGTERITDHINNGFTIIERKYQNLPIGLPIIIERSVKLVLTNNGFYPIRGREYYNIECLPLILNTIDRLVNENAN